MRALITGIAGQDAAYLSHLLLKKDYEVFGIDILPNLWRLEELGVKGAVHILSADISDVSSLVRALRESEADEVYHLASQSFVGSSFDHPIAAGMTTGLGALNVLEACRMVDAGIKMYNAATSELYGDSLQDVANEHTPFSPASPYAIAKMYAFYMTKLYREAYHMFACSGILFNHESPLRGEEFVTRKVTLAASKIKLGLLDKVFLGNLESRRDWGYAKDYVEAMWLMLQQQTPTDLIIATNESHSVRELCERTFGRLGLNWEQHVETSPEHTRPKDVNYLRGDWSKAKEMLGWEPKVRFAELIDMMVDADYERVTAKQNINRTTSARR